MLIFGEILFRTPSLSRCSFGVYLAEKRNAEIQRDEVAQLNNHLMVADLVLCIARDMKLNRSRIYDIDVVYIY